VVGAWANYTLIDMLPLLLQVNQLRRRRRRVGGLAATGWHRASACSMMADAGESELGALLHTCTAAAELICIPTCQTGQSPGQLRVQIAKH
jgi:hypothetical protein